MPAAVMSLGAALHHMLKTAKLILIAMINRDAVCRMIVDIIRRSVGSIGDRIEMLATAFVKLISFSPAHYAGDVIIDGAPRRKAEAARRCEGTHA